jgi:hypothetical protein
MNSFFKSWLFVFVFWAAVVGSWIIGLIYFLPFKYWWFDIVMHFFGGLWVISLILFLKRYFIINFINKDYYIVSLLMLVGLVVFVGLIWEFMEFIADRYVLKTGFTYMRGVYEDTLSDLLMDIIGGTFGAIVYLLNNKNSNA